MRRYFPIAKVDAERREVWGYAATEAEDDQGEIIRREALVAALGDYMKFANIREMHQLSAVGVACDAGVDDKGLYIGAHIVDRDAWEKVVAGVYKGYSIGGRVTARDPDDRRIITGLVLNEISLVDRPANPEAVFDYFAAAQSGALGTLADSEAGERLAAIAQPVQIWACNDPAHRHRAKAEAARCLEKAATPAAAEYADPGYQADGRARYPIDSEAHIRAAWAYINHPRNAGKYTPAQLDHIRARIVAAWRERIDPAGPPAAAQETRKSLDDSGRVAHMIRDLDWLDGQLEQEPAADGDDGTQPARLRAIVAELCRFLDGLVPGDAGASVAGPQPEPAMIAAAARGAGLAKALAAERDEKERLLKLVGEFGPRLDALAKRVEEIAATPLPPLTIAKGSTALTKQQDGGGELPPATIAAAFASLSREEQTLALIKASYANPIRMPR